MTKETVFAFEVTAALLALFVHDQSKIQIEFISETFLVFSWNGKIPEPGSNLTGEKQKLMGTCFGQMCYTAWINVVNQGDGGREIGNPNEEFWIVIFIGKDKKN